MEPAEVVSGKVYGSAYGSSFRSPDVAILRM
jgi:hypothetical protein